MNMEQSKQEPGKSFGKTFIQLVTGAGIGYAWIYAFDKLIGIKWVVENNSGPGLFAFVLATILSLTALIVFVMSFSKTALTYNRASADMDDEEFAETKPVNRWSAIGMLIYAAAFVLLALGASSTAAPQTGYFWAVVACMVAQLGIGRYLWRRYDELWREVTKEACAISFTIIEVVLVTWAAASLFGLGVTFDPLAVIVTTTSIYTLVTIGLTMRRGLTA